MIEKRGGGTCLEMKLSPQVCQTETISGREFFFSYKWQHTVQQGSEETEQEYIHVSDLAHHHSSTCSSLISSAAPMEVWVCVVILVSRGLSLSAIGLVVWALCARQRVWQAEGWKGICSFHHCASSCMWEPHRQVECEAQTKTVKALIQYQFALFSFDKRSQLFLTTDSTTEQIFTD